MKTKQVIVKRLHSIVTEILKADERELDKIGLELLEIEKKILAYTPEVKTNVKTNK